VPDTITPEEFKALSGKRAHKYNAKPTVEDGVRYPSRAEARRARQLRWYVKDGLYLWFARQVLFRLGVPEFLYKADFVVCDNKGYIWVEEVKGTETAMFRKVRQLWEMYGPLALHILKRDGSEWKKEIIEGTR